MSSITTSQIGTGTTAYATDIVVKDLDLDVSNRVKDDTPILNMAMSKKRKANATNHLWTVDTFRLPGTQAWQEGAAVVPSMAQSNSRYNLSNYTQIFATVIGASGTARAMMQSGGDPQAYQQTKQLTELFFDVETQIVRNDQIGTKYSGQAGAATGLSGATQIGRRMGSLASYAGTLSFNTTSGATDQITTWTNNESTDSATSASGAFNIAANGSQFYTGTFTNQSFSPITYKQLVTVAEQRYNAKIRTIVSPVSLRTSISDLIVSSNNSVNRRNVERGDTIATYEGDFNYTYEIFDSWILDQSGVANSLYFLNEEVLYWASLRDLGPNTEIFSNADASLDQFIMEGTLVVRNQAGVAMLNNIANPTGSNTPTSARPAALVQRNVV